MVELFSTTAVAMAGLSMGLTIGSALGSRRGATPQPAAPPSAAAVTPKRITTRPVLQEHARTIGIDRSKSWIHGATRAIVGGVIADMAEDLDDAELSLVEEHLISAGLL